MKIQDDYMAIRKGFSRPIDRQGEPGKSYYFQDIATPFGFAVAYSQHDHARIDFIWRGRRYVRTIRPAPTERGLVRMAFAFAREIAAQAGSKRRTQLSPTPEGARQ